MAQIDVLRNLKRLVIPPNNKSLRVPKKRTAVFKWAVENGFNAVVFPFGCPDTVTEEAVSSGLAAEAGGWVMSLLLPRRRYFFHRDLFRMEGGKRKTKTHFCPTSPETIAILRQEGEKIFRSAGKIEVFHLWPDKGEERTWCSCPTCRAFTHAEQNRMAVNAIADALAGIKPNALLSYYEEPGEDSEMPLRPNVFRIDPEKITALT